MQILTDRDVAYDILYGCKQGAEAYMMATIESASPRCREVFHRLHDDCLRSQWRVWELLHRNSEYRVDTAARQEIEDVRQRMEQLRRSRHRQIGAVDGDSRWSGGRWATSEPAYPRQGLGGWDDDGGRTRGYAAVGTRGERETEGTWSYDDARRAQPSTHRY